MSLDTIQGPDRCRAHQVELGADGYALSEDRATVHTRMVCVHESVLGVWFREQELRAKYDSLLKRYRLVVPCLAALLEEDSDA